MNDIPIQFLPSDRDASGRTLGREEIELLHEVIEGGNLFCVPGNMVPRFEREFAEMYGMPHARAVTSGTAAVHTALAALDIAPGDEVVTTPITDMGAISPILYQGAVPVHADVDPWTMNVTADTIRPRISERTKAIIVTHLFGNPCDMDPIMALAAEHDIPIVEDSAQAYLATYKGQLVGTFGDLSTFSFQQGKHMTTGEGGMVLSSDPELARRARVWADKGWNYDPQAPDHEFMGLNYRMTELQGAVGLAQLRKLPTMVADRVKSVASLLERIADIPGIDPARVHPEAKCTWWRIPLFVDSDVTGVAPGEIEKSLIRVKVWAKAGYISRPTFHCAQFTEKRTFGDTWWPYSSHGAPLPPETLEEYPGTAEALRRVLVIPWTEHHTEEHAEYVADQIRSVVEGKRSGAASGGKGA
ncbi:MAG: DegT/DnrJ/EryC1/StrS family aminotransferase [Gemmatimonadota bacterium]